MYPQGNQPDSWQQYNQQPDPYAGYAQQPMPQYPYGAPPPPPRGGGGGRTALIIIGAVVAAFVMICGAGVLIVAVGAGEDDPRTNRADSAGSSAPTGTATPTSTPRTTGTPTEESIEGDLDEFDVGECLSITGSENKVEAARCTDSGAYKVLLRRDGTTDSKVCDGTQATDFLYQDGVGTSKDLVLCIAKA